MLISLLDFTLYDTHVSTHIWVIFRIVCEVELYFFRLQLRRAVYVSRHCVVWAHLKCTNTKLKQYEDNTNTTFCYHGTTAPSGPRPPLCRGFTITLRHTTLSSTPLDEQSTHRRDLYLTTHSIHKRQTSMVPAGLEPTILVGERPKTHALDRSATGKNFDSTVI